MPPSHFFRFLVPFSLLFGIATAVPCVTCGDDFPEEVAQLGHVASDIFRSCNARIEQDLAFSLNGKTREILEAIIAEKLTEQIVSFHKQKVNPYHDVRYPYFGFLPQWELKLRLEILKEAYEKTSDPVLFKTNWITHLEEETLLSFEVMELHKDLAVDTLGKLCTDPFIKYFQWKIDKGLEADRERRFAMGLVNFKRLLKEEEQFVSEIRGMADEFARIRERDKKRAKYYTDQQKSLAQLNQVRWRVWDDSRLEKRWIEKVVEPSETVTTASNLSD